MGEVGIVTLTEREVIATDAAGEKVVVAPTRTYEPVLWESRLTEI